MTIKASHDRIAARYPHVLFALGDSAPQELYCEECGEDATADDWIAALGALLCPLCLERLMDSTMESRP